MLAGLLLLGTPAATAATHKDVAVSGAGSTFISNMIEQWKADFNKSTGVSISYAAVGSGAGRTQLIAGTVDFGASDVPAKEAEVQQLKDKYGDFVYVASAIGGISVHYNVPGLSGLKLTAPTVAKIFNGSITNWNDPAIAADNGTAGPNLPIQAFVRSDKSGTTGVFTDYLTKASGGAWAAGFTETFPTDKGQIGKAGSDGVSNAVKATQGGIGYGEHSFAIERGLPEALIKNGAGQFVGPEPVAVTTAIDDAMLNPNGTLSINFTTTKPGAYPISATAYLLIPTKMDSKKAENLVEFMNYALSNEGQAKTIPVNYAPLPEKLRTAGRAALARISPTTAQAAPAPVPAPAPAPTTAPAPAPTTAPKPVAAAKAAPKPAATPRPAAATAQKPAAVAAAVDGTAPDPALASTGAGSALAAALSGTLLAFGGLCVGLGRKRRAVPA
jgi:phosphate transport system substrate-binding protein